MINEVRITGEIFGQKYVMNLPIMLNESSARTRETIRTALRLVKNSMILRLAHPYDTQEELEERMKRGELNDVTMII